MTDTAALPISMVIPTYRRGAVLLDTVQALLWIAQSNDELILVDQTIDYPQAIAAQLQSLHEGGSIRWIRLAQPSIPAAMNVGLVSAANPVVLFLDDDIVPDPQLLNAHRVGHATAKLVAGMVLQPGQVPQRLASGERFRFNSDAPAAIKEFMGGNFSIKRDVAISMRGFDENFVGAAFRFEAEFAHRFVTGHGDIRYLPSAVIHHLQLASGGTRAVGHHLTTSKPTHSVGAYYFLLATRQPGWRWQFLRRPLRAIRTRYHLRHVWRIPITLLAEWRGVVLARRLHRRGAALMPLATETNRSLSNHSEGNAVADITHPDISIVIPTFMRERVLLETLQGLLSLVPPAREILVIDQSPTHEAATTARLDALEKSQQIRWIRLTTPSIVAAMNCGLLTAVGEVVLFVDDDVLPSTGLLASHAAAQLQASLVVGQVLQPGEVPLPLRDGEAFRFNSTEDAWVTEFIGCNFSVNRVQAIQLGGFDENFVGAAYRYEAEFSHRYTQKHGPIRFAPQATLRHLRAGDGGTRAFGDHLRTLSARHSVGAFYCLLMTRPNGWRRQIFWRPLRAVRTRFHLRRPWWIPLAWVAEWRGLWLALRLARTGPRFLQTGESSSAGGQ